MDVSILEEARLKLGRGQEHLDTLDAELRRFHHNEPYTVVGEYDPDSAKYLARFKILKPIPRHGWGLILGDAVHNARSALDYIAWRLAGGDPTDLITLFPICNHPAKFKSMQYRLKRMHPSVVAEIRDLQPYQRPDPKHDPLWLLEELDARDKHKLIAMTQSVTRAVSFDGRGDILIPYATFEQPVEDNAILAESTDPNVEMELAFSSSVIFDRNVISAASGDYSVIRCITEAFWAVECVIRRFERIFMGYPHLIP
jgi:hypothetical protein